MGYEKYPLPAIPLSKPITLFYSWGSPQLIVKRQIGDHLAESQIYNQISRFASRLKLLGDVDHEISHLGCIRLEVCQDVVCCSLVCGFVKETLTKNEGMIPMLLMDDA